MSAMAYQISYVYIICSIACLGEGQRKHNRSVSLAFVRGIHRWLMDSPHKRTVMHKMFPFDGVIMDAMSYTCPNLNAGLDKYLLVAVPHPLIAAY